MIKRIQIRYTKSPVLPSNQKRHWHFFYKLEDELHEQNLPSLTFF